MRFGDVATAYEIVFVVIIRGVEVDAVRFCNLTDLFLAACEPDKSRVELLDIILHLRRIIPTRVHGDEHWLHDRPSIPAFVERVDNHGDLLQLVRTDVRAEGEAEVEQGPATDEILVRKRMSVLVDLCNSRRTSQRLGS